MGPEPVETCRQPVVEHVAHRNQLDAGVGVERLGRGTGPPAPAADETDADRVRTTRVNQRPAKQRAGAQASRKKPAA